MANDYVAPVVLANFGEAKRPSQYIPGLDGLRTIAFLMVLMRHTFEVTPPQGDGHISWHSGIAEAGAYGLPIFFILSAFLITRLLLAEKGSFGKIDLRAYYIRRSLRIWPLYFLVLGIGALLDLRSHAFDGAAYLSMVTFVSNWRMFLLGPTSLPYRVGALWSIAVEEQFYIVWPFLLAFVRRKGVLCVCAAMTVVAIMSRVALTALGHDWAGFWFPSTAHLDSLAYGTILALVADRLPKINNALWYPIVGASLVGMAAHARYFPHNAPGVPLSIATALTYSIVPVLGAVILGATICTDRSIVTSSLFVHVGKLTFGMYVFHQMILQLLEVRHLVPTEPLKFGLALAVSYVVAWVVFHVYEKRFLRLKHRFERVASRPNDEETSRSPSL